MPKPAPGPSNAISPAGWGAAVNYDAWTDIWVPKDNIALHHGGPSNYPAGVAPYTQTKEKAQLRSWEGYHLSQGWRGLAYSWGVGQTGTLYRIRGWNLAGAHTGDFDDDGVSNNNEVLAILFIGSGNHVSLSPAAQDTIENLRIYLEDEAGVGLTLYGHQEVTEGTTCPGPLLMNYVESHRELEDDMTTEEVTAIVEAAMVKWFGDPVTITDPTVVRPSNQGVVNGVWHPLINGVKPRDLLWQAAQAGGLTPEQVRAIVREELDKTTLGT